MGLDIDIYILYEAYELNEVPERKKHRVYLIEVYANMQEISKLSKLCKFHPLIPGPDINIVVKQPLILQVMHQIGIEIGAA